MVREREDDSAAREAPWDMNLDRYARQMRYAPLGVEGQQQLLRKRALICGCGALGSVLASTLVRAGVGHVRIVDRDFLELNNLQRQVLFDEEDVTSGTPKAIAAAHKLRKINSQVEVEAIVADVDHRNIRSLVHDVDILLDGTDNFETRFLLNDTSLHFLIPWVYGGCIGAEGQTMTILPGKTPCLRCLMRDTPPAGATPSCDTAGILGPIVNVVASYQACEAIKILSGRHSAINQGLMVFEMWDNRVRQIGLDSLRELRDCPACHRQEFPWLTGERGSQSAVLCGRNAVQLSQVHADPAEPLNFDTLYTQWQAMGRVQRNAYLMRLELESHVLTVFPDGRAIVGGTEDIAEARSLYARYVGH